MTLKELFEKVSTAPLTHDSKLFMVGGSEAEDLFNCITNCTSDELFKFLYAVYTQNDVFKEAIDAVRVQIESDLKVKAPVGQPANTIADDTKAKKAVEDAMKELGAIYVDRAKSKS